MLHVERAKDDPLGLIKELAERSGRSINQESLCKLEVYVHCLLEWNEKHNLISRTDTANVWQRHVLHSLIPVLMFSVPRESRFVDIGSGGGLPGIPIAIVRPDLRGVLVDSVRKKTEALSAMIERVDVSNLEVVNDRVESGSFRGRFQNWFDIAFARGVAALPDLVKWSVKILRKGQAIPTPQESLSITAPSVVAFKGGDVEEEIRRTSKQFPGSSIRVHKIDVEGITDESFTDKKLIIVRLQA